MKITITLEVKRSPKKKKSPAPKKPKAQSDPTKNTIIINQK